MQIDRRIALLAIVPLVLGVTGLTQATASAPAKNDNYRLVKHDPARDVVTYTTPARRYSPSDDIRRIIVTHNHARLRITFKTARFAAHVAANTTITYDINIGQDDVAPPHRYEVLVTVGGSKAALPNGSRIPHYRHLWEHWSVLSFTNGESDPERICRNQRLVPSAKHVWIDTVPNSCVPDFQAPVLVRGSRERQVNEGPGQPAHDFEDDF